MDNFCSPSSSSKSPSACVTLCARVCMSHTRSYPREEPGPSHSMDSVLTTPAKGTFLPAEHSAELVSTGNQTLAISQITVLKKSLRGEMLVNKSLLLIWFTTFLRTLRANFSTLLRLWGTADTVEPVPSCGWPASPQSARGCGWHFTWRRRSGEKHNVWLFVKAGKGSSERPEKAPKHVRKPSSVSRAGAAKAVAEGGEGSQALLGRRAGWFCGQGRAGWAARRAWSWVPSVSSSERLMFCVHPGFPLWQRGRSAALHFTVGLGKLRSWGSRCKPPPPYHPKGHWCVQSALTASTCSRWRGKPCEYTLRLFSFTLDLCAKASCTWYLLVLESNIVTSVWHWA